MTQMQIEKLNQEEYSHYLAFGEPIDIQASFAFGDENVSTTTAGAYHTEHSEFTHQEGDWISTLVSTTYPDLTFGYSVVPSMYTVV